MAEKENVTIERIEEDIAVIERADGISTVEYPIDWIPFTIHEGDVLEAIVHYCDVDVISRITFLGFNEEEKTRRIKEMKPKIDKLRRRISPQG